MNIEAALNRFYYNMTLNELKMMNGDTPYPNITYNSLLYLDLISYTPNCTASYLAGILHISKPAVTAKVNELIRQGFVVKKQSEEDKRVYYLSISPAVEEEYKLYDKKFSKAVQKLKQSYSEKELLVFCDMLDLIDSCYQDGKEK